MTVKITYFVHGTTTDNENHIATGWNHGELSELGIKQAKELGKLVASKNFDVVFCSDLKRAVDSAKLGFDGYKIIQDKRLRECNYGDWNGAEGEKVYAYPCLEKAFPNGESYHDVEKRVRDFLKMLKEKYDEKHIAIVAHKAPQLALDVVLNGKTWEQAIKEDWRKTGKWRPGWEYEINPNIIIKKSTIEGEGVFANRDFKKGEVVIKWNTDTTLTKEEVDNLPEKEKRYAFPSGGKFILQQSPAKYVNHSCDPNTKVVDNNSDVALRDIKKGEEITSDYSDSFIPGQTMACTCGSKKCRGIVENKR